MKRKGEKEAIKREGETERRGREKKRARKKRKCTSIKKEATQNLNMKQTQKKWKTHKGDKQRG